MTASMLSVGRSAAMNTEQEAVVPSKEIRGTTAAALVAAWAVDESSTRNAHMMGKKCFFKGVTSFIRLYPANE